MLDRERVLAALEAKAPRFAGYELRVHDALEAYAAALAALADLSSAELAARLAGVTWPGARPTDEHDRYPDLVVPFGRSWSNHAAARAWARDVLAGVPTVAVDGSQITPSRDLSLPVGAVQIGWFVNPHAPGQPYVKDIAFEVLAPDELSDESEEVLGFPDWRVNLRRFVGECERLAAWMETFADAEPKPVCFFDGSLIVSFAAQMRPARQRRYVQAVTRLLDASRTHRVPLVGYVDTSYAKDVTAMLDVVTDHAAAHPVSDGALLRARLGWGDRTTAWICARSDAVEPVGDAGKYYEDVAFVYLQVTADRPPARLDVPCWLLEAGALERTLDIVRAECVVGNGYPYAVETADAVAVITRQDRARFYRVLQAFAEEQNLPLRFSRKTISKQGRR
jgi:hypothetical protein